MQLQLSLAAIFFSSSLKNIKPSHLTSAHFCLFSHTLTHSSNFSSKPHFLTMEEPPTTQSKSQPPPLSKRAQKRVLKQQRFEAKKAEKKAQEKEHKLREKERKKKEWEDKLSNMSSEEEKLKLIEAKKGVRKERMAQRSEERENKIQRLSWAKSHGQNIVIDLEFSNLMTPNELNSLVQQIMYCYAVNGRCPSPCHLWLTGCEGNMGSHLQKIPGFDKWMIERESQSYIKAFQDRKENLVYLTADAETVLDDLDPRKIYIIGGLVDRNRWKGLTMKKAQEQGIEVAKLPIGNYLKMSSSQVLTVNQVVEILLKYLEIRDWKASFFQVIPQRKRCESGSGDQNGTLENEEITENDSSVESQKKLKLIGTIVEASEREVEDNDVSSLWEDTDLEASKRVAYNENDHISVLTENVI